MAESEVSATHLFGFAGSGRISNIFDYVLVTADLRAYEESQDGRNTVIGRILERTVDRTAANEAMALLGEEIARRHSQINSDHVVPQLMAISDELNREIGLFTRGRTVHVQPAESEYKPQSLRCLVRVMDNLTETDVERQGHGFQRSLLIAALKLLATHRSDLWSERTTVLAIEEPELFQHPTQCRSFAQVLRDLAGEDGARLQIAYATHSPYFVDSRFFDQIRRVHRELADGEEHATVRVSHATLEAICVRLAGYVPGDGIRRRLGHACTNELAEAVFAQAAVLTEGPGDQGVIEGTAGRDRHLPVDGIAVAMCGGKENIFLNHAILTALGIPCYVVFDGDRDCCLRMQASGRPQSKITEAEEHARRSNRRLLEYLGYEQHDWPDLMIGPLLTVFPDTIETYLAAEWPDWEATRSSLISSQRGFGGKNAATYALASEQASANPPAALDQLLANLRNLVVPTSQPRLAPSREAVPSLESQGTSGVC